jgi:hypothetical protein
MWIFQDGVVVGCFAMVKFASRFHVQYPARVMPLAAARRLFTIATELSTRLPPYHGSHDCRMTSTIASEEHTYRISYT